MKCLRVSRWGAVVIALSLFPASILAAPVAPDSPLAQVPAGSPIVIHFHGIERTKGRLITMIKKAIPDLGAMAEQKISAGWNMALEGRKLQGVAADGSVLVAFTQMPNLEGGDQGPPKMAFIIAVTKYADFRDGILKEEERSTLKKDSAGFEQVTIQGETVYWVDRKGYAVITPSKEVAEQFTKKQEGLHTRIEKPLIKKLLESDVALYIDTTAFNKQYAEKIKEAREQLQNLLEQAAQMNASNKDSIEAFRSIIGPMFQAFEDSRGLVLAIEFRPEGFAFNGQAVVGPESTTNKALKDTKPSALSDLGQMPAGYLFYDGTAMSPAMIEKLATYFLGAMPGEGPDKKELNDAVKELLAARPQLRFGATNMPLSGIQVWTCEDATKAEKAQLKILETLKEGSSFTGLLKNKPEIKTKAEKYRNFELTSVKMVWDLDKMLESAGPIANNEEGKKAMTAMMKAMLGEGTTAWFGSDGKSMVKVFAPDWSAAKAILDNHFDKKVSVGQTEAYKETRKEMPSETTLLYLIDVPQYAGLIGQVIDPMLSMIPLPLPPGFLKPAVKGKTSFLGIAVTLQPLQGSFDLFIPGKAANEIYKMYVEKLMK